MNKVYKRTKKALVLSTLLSLSTLPLYAQHTPASWNTPGAGNPLLPGYFADPTIRKFGDTYYIYATTDGTGNGYGPAQAWISKDFVNWRNVLLNWPTTEVVWAPDVVQEPDSTYRYYYCTNECVVRVGESKSPLGPWTNRLGKTDAALVHDRFVKNAITLDPALFRDDDGSEYLYFGTWGIYKGFGCGVAKLSDDGKSFTDKKLIENTEITDFFEAPYVFKRNGKYYFTYSSGSCHDDTYRVQYAIADHPMGPYTYKGCILKTNSDGTVHGPGHHSILVDGDNYYIVYHRHNNPHSIHGFHRQVCIDKMEFDADGNIKNIEPTHEGLIPASLKKEAKLNTAKNLAYKARVIASSTYSDWFKPEYAVDDNNGTLWRATNCLGEAWLQIDLGRLTQFDEVFTQFEYPTFFYQYKIETSRDGKNWSLYADRTENTQQGSPMVDTGKARARYIRITITDRQKNGHFPAIWNVKVYQSNKRVDPLKLLPEPEIDEKAIVEGYPWIHKKDLEPTDREYGRKRNHLLLNFDADNYDIGSVINGVPVVPKDNKAAFRFNGSQSIEIDSVNLKSLTYNAPYTVTAWVLNPETSDMETVAQFMPAGNDLATIELRNGTNRAEGIVAHNASMENAGAKDAVKAGKWQHWVVSFDGFNERIYCDTTLVSEKNIFLMLRPGGPITIGASARGNLPFSGFLHSLRLYDRAFSSKDVATDYLDNTDLTPAHLYAIENASPLTGKEPKLALVQVSPNKLIAQVTDQNGKALTDGLFDYAIAIASDSAALSKVERNSDASQFLSIPEGAKKVNVWAKVYDVFGKESKAFNTKLKINAKQFTDRAASLTSTASLDVIELKSAGTNLNEQVDDGVPMRTVSISGDFIAECKVANLTGAERRNTPGFNEGGLLLQDKRGANQSLVQLGVFPNYDCGNMLTVVHHGRPQYPNRKGWNYDPYLQLERRGNWVYARTSKDGKTWTEMPNSPIDISFMGNKKINVGIYQTTYSENEASVSFSDFHIWQKK